MTFSHARHIFGKISHFRNCASIVCTCAKLLIGWRGNAFYNTLPVLTDIMLSVALLFKWFHANDDNQKQHLNHSGLVSIYIHLQLCFHVEMQDKHCAVIRALLVKVYFY